MANEIEFIDGLIVKPPREGAPDYVKGRLSLKRKELITWLQSKEGDWINIDIKESKSGKWYGAVDNWKPETDGTASQSNNTGKHSDTDQNTTRGANTGQHGDNTSSDEVPF